MKKNAKLPIILIAGLFFAAGVWIWQNNFFGFFNGLQSSEESLKKEESFLKEFMPRIVQKEVAEETEEYGIEINYPSIVGLADDKVSEEISRYFQGKAQREANEFKKDVKENAIKEMGVQSQLISKYEVFWHNADFLSFKTETMYYVAGMAHPSIYNSVFNYDIAGKKQLLLSDFFNPGVDYLEKVSIKAKEEAKKITGEYYNEEMAMEGASPKKENYENFLFNKNGLTFIFGQYQVAPYVAGIISVEIPYSYFSEINSQSQIIKKITEL